jgi:hypothetical protein
VSTPAPARTTREREEASRTSRVTFVERTIRILNVGISEMRVEVVSEGLYETIWPSDLRFATKEADMLSAIRILVANRDIEVGEGTFNRFLREG